MAIEPGLRIVDHDEDGVDTAFREDVLAGLVQRHKAIPARWFYDETGSQLFERITELPEYYPTRAETEILKRHGADFADAIGPGRAVVEFGSGSSTKTPLLLRRSTLRPMSRSTSRAISCASPRRRWRVLFPACRFIRSRPTSPSRSICRRKWWTCPRSGSSPAQPSATWFLHPQSICCVR